MPNISSDTIITKLNNATGDSVIQLLTATMSTLQSGNDMSFPSHKDLSDGQYMSQQSDYSDSDSILSSVSSQGYSDHLITHPQDYSLTAITVLASILAVPNLVGNMMVLMAFRRLSVQFRVPAHALLLPLAFSDILIGVWSILNIINVGEDNMPMNRVRGLLGVTGSTGAIMSVTLISLDRVVSLAFPFSYTLDKTRILALYAVSIIALLTGSAVAEIMLVPEYGIKTDSHQPTQPDTLQGQGFTQFMMIPESIQILLLIFIFIPCSVCLILSHIYLIRVARRHEQSIRRVKKTIAAKEISDNAWLSGTPTSYLNDRISPRHARCRIRSRGSGYTSSLLTTFVAFFTSWLPAQLIPLLVSPNHSLYSISCLPVLISCALNPILYTAQNKDMRDAVRKLFYTEKPTSMLSMYKRQLTPENQKLLVNGITGPVPDQLPTSCKVAYSSQLVLKASGLAGNQQDPVATNVQSQLEKVVTSPVTNDCEALCDSCSAERLKSPIMEMDETAKQLKGEGTPV